MASILGCHRFLYLAFAPRFFGGYKDNQYTNVLDFSTSEVYILKTEKMSRIYTIHLSKFRVVCHELPVDQPQLEIDPVSRRSCNRNFSCNPCDDLFSGESLFPTHCMRRSRFKKVTTMELLNQRWLPPSDVFPSVIFYHEAWL